MDLAARFAQYWVCNTVEPNVFAEGSYHEALPVVRRQVEQFEAACVAYGRDPGTVRRLLVTGPNIGVLASKDVLRRGRPVRTGRDQ